MTADEYKEMRRRTKAYKRMRKKLRDLKQKKENLINGHSKVTVISEIDGSKLPECFQKWGFQSILNGIEDEISRIEKQM